jgi:hypothetical protein
MSAERKAAEVVNCILMEGGDYWVWVMKAMLNCLRLLN